MSTFKLEISTPDEMFYSDEAECLMMTTDNGSVSVLPGHAPMLVAIIPGELKIKSNGEYRSFLSMDGFVEVTGKKVIMYTRAAMWEDEMAEKLSEKEKKEAIEKLRRQKSIFEHEHTKIQLTRAMSNLSKSKNRNM